MNDAERTREVVERYFSAMSARDWDSFAELLAADVVYELPQSSERITGRAKYRQFNEEYPGDWSITLTRLIVDGTTAAGSLNATIDGQPLVGLVFFELRDGLIERITDFWPETFEPLPGREHLVERVPAAVDRL